MAKSPSKKPTKKIESIFHLPIELLRPALQKTYSDEFLEKICAKAGIKAGLEKQNFCKGVRFAIARYVELKRANPVGIRPTEQNKILEKYKRALGEAQLQYREIHRFTSTSIKLGKAIRKKYKETNEPGMKEMFNPYCDGQGMAISLFDKFLGVLADAAEDAKKQDIGNDKADFSSKFLMEWVAAMGKFWPENATITFALGKRDKGQKIYTSRSISILYDIISKVEPSISEKKIENAMRKVSKKDLINQSLALFYLR